jgi:hypothetical protein
MDVSARLFDGLLALVALGPAQAANLALNLTGEFGPTTE